MVVVRATYAKFTTSRHAVELRRRLLATGERELVEASASDRMWGAGVGRTAALTHTGKWPGKNLLGEALMEVRARLRLEGSDGSLIVKSGA
jgi:ribA/ribD-fused uncharacterized protein